MHIIDGLKNPAAEKFDGGQAHRSVLTPAEERGVVSTMGQMVCFARTPLALSVWPLLVKIGTD